MTLKYFFISTVLVANCLAIYHKPQWFKTINIHWLTVSVVRGYKSRLARRRFLQLQSESWCGCWHLKGSRGLQKLLPKLFIHIAAGRQSQVSSHRSLSIACLNVLKILPLASPRKRKIQERGRQSHTVSPDPVSQVSHGHFLFLNLFVRSR